jgi:hypothetical protein
MLYADGIGDDSVNDCRQNERGQWVCNEQPAVGATPFWQGVDHWNFAESVSPSSSPWGSFKTGRAYSYPRESTCSECVGTPVGYGMVAPGSVAKTLTAVALVAAAALGIAYYASR